MDRCRTITKNGGGLTRSVAFRLSEVDYLAYQSKFKTAGVSQSEFFRQYVLTNTTQVLARPAASANKQRLVYLFNKTSNNLNQIAFRTNSAHLDGVLSEFNFLAILGHLQLISASMKSMIEGIDNAD